MKKNLESPFLLNLILFFVISTLSLSCSKRNKSKKQPIYTEIESKIDSLMNESKHRDFKGSVLVSKHDTIVFQKSYGNKQSNLINTFWVGSMAKSFTAAAILKLQDEKKLSVNDSIIKFFTTVPQDKRGITIHHLLTHSSGLGNNYVSDGITERRRSVEAIFNSKLIGAIGGEYSYSVEGYNLLAIIIEVVSGESYEEYLTNHIFIPAQLENSGFWGFEDKNPGVALVPWKNPKAMDKFSSTVFNNAKSQSNYGFKGATGIYSTTQDLAKWICALNAEHILSAESYDLMFQPHVSARGNLENGTFYGYGWLIEFKDGVLREIRHYGVEDGGIGHNGAIRFYENGDQIIVLSNAGNFQGDGDLKGIEWGIVLSFDLRDIIEVE